MPKVEIYTKTFCPYCWRAKQLLDSKGVEYQEIAVDFGGAKQAGDGPARRTAGRPSRRSSSTAAMSAAATTDARSSATASSTSCWPPDMTRIALFQSHSGHRSGGQCRRRWSTRSARRRRAARRCCSRPKCRACSTATASARRGKPATRGGRRGARRVPRGGARARHLGASRLARGAAPTTARLANRGFVIDARARSARATTRSICSTSTCRPARAGASPPSIAPARARWWSTARRSASSA